MTDEKKYDVLAIGDAIVDTLVKAEEVFLDKINVKKRSVALIDKDKATSLFGYMDTLRKNNEQHILKDIKDMSGGSAANTAAGLASFGAKVAYIGRVHADAEGKRFSEKLEGRGIECLTPPSVDGENTGRSLVIITPDGARTMCTYIGSKTQVGDISEEAVKAASWIYFPAFMFDSQEGTEAAIKAIEYAQTHQVKVAMSLSDAGCVSRHRNLILELVANAVDVVFSNMAEASALMGAIDNVLNLKAFQALCEKRAFIAVITSAEKGADIVTADEILNVPGIQVESPVDKTGVGALFASGFLYGLIKNMSHTKCGTLGNLAAVEGIKVFGARPTTDLSQLLKNI